MKSMLPAPVFLFLAACGGSDSLKDLAKDGAKLDERLAAYVEKGEDYGFPAVEYIGLLKSVDDGGYAIVRKHEAGVVKRLGWDLKQPLYDWIVKERTAGLARAIRTLNAAAEFGKTDKSDEVVKSLVAALGEADHDVHSSAGKCLAFLYSYKWGEAEELFRDHAVGKLDPAGTGVVMLYCGMIRHGCVAVPAKRVREMAGVVLCSAPHPFTEEAEAQEETGSSVCRELKELEASVETGISGLKKLWEKNWKYVYIDREAGGVAVFKVNKDARTIEEEVDASTGIQLKDK